MFRGVGGSIGRREGVGAESVVQGYGGEEDWERAGARVMQGQWNVKESLGVLVRNDKRRSEE